MDVLGTLQIIAPASRLADEGVPCASIAVLDDESISSGIISNDRAYNDETLLQACSISKAVTSLAVARLVDLKKLEYTTSITELLPDSVLSHLFEPSTRALLQYVTVEKLLSHTAGLSQGGFQGYRDKIHCPSVEALIAGEAPSNSPRIRLIHFPGARWSYSGGGTTIIQLALERLLGLNFEDLMDSLVIKPLGMTRSRYTGSEGLSVSETDFAAAYHTGFQPCDVAYNRLVEMAAAGLWTTPTDLLKMTLAIQKSLRGDPDAFLSASTTKVMLAPMIDVPSWGQGVGMARGLFIDDWTFSHLGSNDPGYRCAFFGSLDGGRGIAVMTNSKCGHATVQKLVNAILYLKKWKAVEAMPHRDFVPYRQTDTQVPPSSSYESWVGDWEGYKIFVEHGSPWFTWKDLSPVRLWPAAGLARDGAANTILVAEGLEIAVELRRSNENFEVAMLAWGIDADAKGSWRILKRSSPELQHNKSDA